MRRIGTIRVPGKPSQVDSFAACLQAGLREWGRNVPYDCVTGLSGVAFSPPLDTEARCPGRWMEAGSDVRVHFLGHALGFTVESGTGAASAEGAAAERSARRVRAAMEDGAIVLCRSQGGWVVVGRPPDGSDGYTLAGPGCSMQRSDLPLRSKVYILGPTERSLTSCEALRAAVQFAALVACSPCAVEGIAFGGRVYDEWVNRLSEETFCPECGEDEWRCAERASGRARDSHLSAIRFLNRAYDFLPPEQNSESLRDAACSFAAMANTLAPYAGGLRDLWQDRAERSRYADGVARLRDLHKEAGRHLCVAADVL